MNELETLIEKTAITAKKAVEALVEYINAITAERNYYRDKCDKLKEE